MSLVGMKWSNGLSWLMRDSDMPECPTCEKELNTEVGVKQHHAKVHGESIAGVERNCDWCGDKFTRRPSNVDICERDFCSTECSGAFKSEKRSKEWQGLDHPQAKPENFPKCEWCGDRFQTDSHDRERGRGRFCSQECHYEWRRNEWDAPSGEDAPAWNGGPVDYGENWYEVREKVRERDDFECQSCGVDEGLLDVHHITPRRKFNDVENANKMDNLILLCRSCHMEVEHGDRELVNDGF